MDKKLKFILCIIVFLLLSLSVFADIESIIKETDDLLKQGKEVDVQQTLDEVDKLILEGKESEARVKFQKAYPNNNEGTYKFNDRYLDYLQNQHLDLEAFNLLSNVRQGTTSSAMTQKNKDLTDKLDYIKNKLTWVENGGVSGEQEQRIHRFTEDIESKEIDANYAIKRKKENERRRKIPSSGDGGGGDGGGGLGDKIKNYGWWGLIIIIGLVIIFVWILISRFRTGGLRGLRDDIDFLRGRDDELDEVTEYMAESTERGRRGRRTPRRNTGGTPPPDT